MLALTTLNRLGEAKSEDDAADALIVEVLDIAPTHQPEGINLRIRVWDEAGTAQHTEKIEKRQDFINCECFVQYRAKRV